MKPTLNRRTLLSRGLKLSAGILTAGATTAAAGTAPAGAIPRSGGALDYLTYDIQDGWLWCSRCRGLFHRGPQGERVAGVCPWGGAHNAAGSWAYALPYNTIEYGDTPLHQQGWRHCRDCFSLVYIQDGSGRCPAGGDHYTAETDNHYSLFFNNGANSEEYQHQNGWAYCYQCKALFYGPQTSGSRCPADHDVHGPNTTYNYQPLVLSK